MMKMSGVLNKILNEVLIDWDSSSKKDIDSDGIIKSNQINFDIPLEEVCKMSVDELEELLGKYDATLGTSNKEVTWNVEITHWIPVEKRPLSNDKYNCSDYFIKLKEGMPEDVKDLIADNVRRLFYKKPYLPSRFEILYFLYHKYYISLKDGYSSREIFYQFIFDYIISGIKINVSGIMEDQSNRSLRDIMSKGLWLWNSGFNDAFFNTQNIIKKMFVDALNPAAWGSNGIDMEYAFPDVIVNEPPEGIYKWCLDKFGSDAHIAKGFWSDIYNFLNPDDDSKADIWYEKFWSYRDYREMFGRDLFQFINDYPI